MAKVALIYGLRLLPADELESYTDGGVRLPHCGFEPKDSTAMQCMRTAPRRGLQCLVRRSCREEIEKREAVFRTA
jgi:hypothetical protein